MSFSSFTFTNDLTSSSHYNSFPDDDDSMTMDTFCDLLLQKNKQSLYKILPHIYPYLTLTDIIVCASVNREFNKTFSICKDPDFNKLGYIHDGLFMLNKFLVHLQTTPTRTQSLNLSNIQESLYDQVNPNFFRLIVQSCPDLSKLDLSNCDFFTLKSLPTKTYWQLPALTVLNLSHCSQVTDDMIVSIARGCRKLTHVTLDHLTRHKGKGLAGIAVECDQLEYVSARFNTSMQDQALIALAKFRHIRLLKLDLTGCTKLTSIGFEILARYCAHLTHLSLSQTSCKITDLCKFICILRSTIKLDISDCKHLLSSIDAVADWMWNNAFSKLDQLVMDTRIATALVHKLQSHLVDVKVRKVTLLTLTNLPEWTPISYVYQLLTLFPFLEHLSFKRAYFETDFMLGTYRPPSPEKEEYITDITIQRFNDSQSHVAVAILNDRQDDRNLLSW